MPAFSHGLCYFILTVALQGAPGPRCSGELSEVPKVTELEWRWAEGRHGSVRHGDPGSFHLTARVLLFVTQWTVAHQASLSIHGDFPGKNTGVGCHPLLQGIFQTQELNQGLLHCRWILHKLNYQGSPHDHQMSSDSREDEAKPHFFTNQEGCLDLVQRRCAQGMSCRQCPPGLWSERVPLVWVPTGVQSCPCGCKAERTSPSAAGRRVMEAITVVTTETNPLPSVYHSPFWAMQRNYYSTIHFTAEETVSESLHDWVSVTQPRLHLGFEPETVML